MDCLKTCSTAAYLDIFRPPLPLSQMFQNQPLWRAEDFLLIISLDDPPLAPSLLPPTLISLTQVPTSFLSVQSFRANLLWFQSHPCVCKHLANVPVPTEDQSNELSCNGCI